MVLRDIFIYIFWLKHNVPFSFNCHTFSTNFCFMTWVYGLFYCNNSNTAQIQHWTFWLVFKKIRNLSIHHPFFIQSTIFRCICKNTCCLCRRMNFHIMMYNCLKIKIVEYNQNEICIPSGVMCIKSWVTTVVMLKMGYVQPEMHSRYDPNFGCR